MVYLLKRGKGARRRVAHLSVDVHNWAEAWDHMDILNAKARSR